MSLILKINNSEGKQQGAGGGDAWVIKLDKNGNLGSKK